MVKKKVWKTPPLNQTTLDVVRSTMYPYGMPPYGFPGMPPQQGAPPYGFPGMPPQQGAAPYGFPGMPPQQMMQASDASDNARSSARGAASRSRSPTTGEVPTFPDDKAKMSSSYRTLGMMWKTGERRCMTKKFRMSLIASCNSLEWPMMRLSQLTDEQVDLLLYICTGISPLTRPNDMGATDKRHARVMAHQQHAVKIERQPTRLQQMSDEMDNLASVAMRLGYAAEWLSPELRQVYDRGREIATNLSQAPPQSICPPATVARSASPAQPADSVHPQQSPLRLKDGPLAAGIPSGHVAQGQGPAAAFDGPVDSVAQRFPPRASWSLPAMKFPSLLETKVAKAPELAVAREGQTVFPEPRMSGRHGTSPDSEELAMTTAPATGYEFKPPLQQQAQDQEKDAADTFDED